MTIATQPVHAVRLRAILAVLIPGWVSAFPLIPRISKNGGWRKIAITKPIGGDCFRIKLKRISSSCDCITEESVDEADSI